MSFLRGSVFPSLRGGIIAWIPEPSLQAAVGCVAILSNILRLLRQLLRNFLAMTTQASTQATP